MPVNPIPEGYRSVTPHLTVKNAAGLIDFIRRVFGARETMRLAGPDGSVVHAEVKIGDSVVMIGEPFEPHGTMPGNLYVYVDDVDSTYQRALDEGAESMMAPADQFYGDRTAAVRDAWGNW
ncbi:MAG: VOC family protein [bacterium]|jgi:PhnB protein